ncbi:MAG: hypothetical protein KAT26_10565, partial [Marinosulfonomonas sp.]|nr:hypothetical protein [Marinosulfonomonas sp.]
YRLGLSSPSRGFCHIAIEQLAHRKIPGSREIAGLGVSTHALVSKLKALVGVPLYYENSLILALIILYSYKFFYNDQSRA